MGKRGFLSEEEVEFFLEENAFDLMSNFDISVLQKNLFFFKQTLTVSNFIAASKDSSFWFKDEEEKEFIYYMFDHDRKGFICLGDLEERFARMSIKLAQH